MKKIEELGISPAPWDFQKNHPDGGVVADAGNWRLSAFNIKPANARLIAAAPELYKWLAYAVEHYKCETRSCNNCPNGKCWIVDASAALAKAAGEEVVDGK